MKGLNGGAEQRLQGELIIWLTTVSPTGQPQTSPVWFWWDGEEFLIYSKAGTARTRNIAANSRVALNLDGDGQGGSVVTVEGEARLDLDAPTSPEVPEFIEKYGQKIASYGWTPAKFAIDYPIPVRVEPIRARSW
jgi:PPOX class probable F420-dependent enzyme